MAKEKEDFFWKLLKGLVKFLWKLFLTLLYGCLKIIEAVAAAFSKWVKDINS